MTDFFISHSSYDKTSITDELVKRLTYKGYSVWYDKNNIFVGDEIREKIKKGLNGSYCCVCQPQSVPRADLKVYH